MIMIQEKKTAQRQHQHQHHGSGGGRRIAMSETSFFIFMGASAVCGMVCFAYLSSVTSMRVVETELTKAAAAAMATANNGAEWLGTATTTATTTTTTTTTMGSPPREEKVARSLQTCSAQQNRNLAIRQHYPIPDHVQVYEDHLPGAVHQECGSVQIGTKLYLMGGLQTKVTDEKVNWSGGYLGSRNTTIYDMATMDVAQGPELPTGMHHTTASVTQEGVVHVVGSYGDSHIADSRDWHYSWDTVNDPDATTWKNRAPLPEKRGALGCKFAGDKRMYCFGGGERQWGPYHNDVFIYDPKTDTWSNGPSSPFACDHLISALQLMDNGRQIIVFGGKGHRRQGNQPALWKDTSGVYLYDIDRQRWLEMRPLAVPRSTVTTTPYRRRGPNNLPNIMLVGGQRTVGVSGHIVSLVEEYDVERDVFYCHEPLPFPFHGGSVGIHKDKLHVVGGAEWGSGLAAARRVQVVDLAMAGEPKPCFLSAEMYYPNYELYMAKQQVRMYPDFSDKCKRLQCKRQLAIGGFRKWMKRQHGRH